MMLPEINSRRSETSPYPSAPPSFDSSTADFDFLSWEVYSCWKQQHSDRFGGGNLDPSETRVLRHSLATPINHLETQTIRLFFKNCLSILRLVEGETGSYILSSRRKMARLMNLTGQKS